MVEKVREALWWLPFGRVDEVTAATLAERIARGEVQVLDVRTEREWRQSHIDGAINVPITRLRRELEGAGLRRDRPVVAICLTAHRSIPAVRILRRAGFRDCVQLQGGMRAWWAAALPTAHQAPRRANAA